MTQAEYQMEQKIKLWNIVAMAIFGGLGYLAFQCLASRGILTKHFSLGEFLILALAILRLIRLVAYDNIALVLREAFLDVKRVSFAEGGEEFIERVPSENSFKRTVTKLLNCPWCIGVWIAFFVLYLYLAYPSFYLVFVLLALASVASMFQVAINLIGWNAEYKKIQTSQLENHK